MLGDTSQSQKDRYCVIPYKVYNGRCRFTETEGRGWVPGQGAGTGQLVFNGGRGSVCGDDKRSERMVVTAAQ